MKPSVSGMTHSLRTAVTVLCLVAQGLVVGHHVLVTHTRCAEHGELVHTDEHSAHVAPLHEAEAEHASVDAGEAAHSDDHEHCTASTDRRKALQAAAYAGVHAVVVVANVSRVVVPGDVPGRAVHVIAPKTSPPV